MAGSRLDKIGTIFSRATGLLQSGAIKYQDRPLWYDIFRVFAPKYEPYIEREPERTSEIPQILYKEDLIRAKFFKRFGLNPQGELRKLGDPTFEEASHVFIKDFMQIEKNRQDYNAEQVFDAAADNYLRSRPTTSRALQDEILSSTKDSDQLSDPVEKSRERRMSIVTAETLKSLFDEPEQTSEPNTKTNK